MKSHLTSLRAVFRFLATSLAAALASIILLSAAGASAQSTNWLSGANLFGNATYGTLADNDVLDNASLMITNGGKLTAGKFIIGPTNQATLTLTNGGLLTIQQLLVTNVVLNGVTNSFLNLSGGTLVTSNAATAIAANILVASNATYSINSSWIMSGGTNTVASVNTNLAQGALVIGNSANNVVVTVNSNATFANYNPSGTATNISSFFIGSGGTSSGNRLIITNGGQATLKNGSGSINLTIGNSAGCNSNAIIVAGTNGAGQKAMLNVGGDRIYIGSSSTIATINNFIWVDAGGIITNASLYSWGINSAFVITNGGMAAGPNAIPGRNGVSNIWTIAGADAIGNRSTLLLTSTGIGLGGGGGTTASPGTNNVLWVGSAGLINLTGTGKINVGSDTNSVGNSLIITNGGQVFGNSASTIGYTAGANNNYVTIGGTFGTTNSLWNLGNTSLTIGNNAAATNNSLTLFAGGILQNVSSVVLSGTGSQLNFNGGKLSASAKGNLIATDVNTLIATNFVQNGGAIIDSGVFTVTNVLPMVQDPGSIGGGLTKQGLGTLTLLGTNTYTGPTTIIGGTLVVKADSATLTGTLTVGGGGSYGGTGTNGGDVIVNAGGILNPGLANAAISTQYFKNNLSLTGSTLVHRIGTTASICDLVNVGGVLTNSGVNYVALSFPNGLAAAGDYTLMTFASSVGAGSFALAAAYPNATLVQNSTSLVLHVVGTGAYADTWTGNISGSWEAGFNWTNGSSAISYADGDIVIFDDTLYKNPIISNATLGAVVSPALVTFNNNLTNYIVYANIGGSGSLTKNGTAALTLAGTNSYSGNTTLNAGTLTVTNGGAINSPAAALNVGVGASPATLALINGGAITVQQLLVTNVIMGGFTNSFMNLSGGTLVTSNAANAIAASIYMNSNASFTVNSSWTMNGGTNLVVSVNTNMATLGAINIGNSANNVVVTVNSNAVFTTQNPWNVNNNTATNMQVTIGNGSGFGNNRLIITNGGRFIARTAPNNGSVGMNLGGGGNSGNGIIVAGTDGLGNKAILDFAGINTPGNGNRLILGGNASTSTNNFVIVGAGGVITNINLYCYNGFTNGMTITNGGQVYLGGGVCVGRTGTSDYLNISGADSAGNRAMLAGANNFAQFNDLLIGGSGGGFGNQASYCNVNIGQNGWVTNINRVMVGPDTNSLGNFLTIANGGQLFSATASMIGAYSNANNNSITIGGSFGPTNALWNLSGKSLTIGGTNWSTNNFVTLSTGGLLTNLSTILMGGAGTVLNFNGGTLAVITNGMLIATNAGTVSATNYVQAGGAVIDTGIYTVTNGLPMIFDPNSTGGGLTKLGLGTLVLTNLNTYTGGTIVSAGKLLVTTADPIANTVVSVLSGATNTVQLAAAGGQLNCAGLTNYNGSTLEINFYGFAPSATTAPLQVTGNFDLNNANLTVINTKSIGAGTYPLIKYGTQTGSLTPATFTLPAGMAATLSNDTVNAVIDLVVTTASTPTAYWAVGNGFWDAATMNWKDNPPAGAANLVYQDGMPVVLDDSSSGTGTILVTNSAPVSPASVVVDVSSKSYTISGSAITGGTALTKNGSSALTLNGANTYAGNTIVNAGILSVVNGGAIYSPAATLNIAPGTLLATNTLDVGGAITVQTLLATNVNLSGANSTLNLNGGTLVTSNAPTGMAANILVNNANVPINSSWSMNGGTNLIGNVNTNANSGGTVFVGYATNNVQVTVNTNALLAFTTFGSATNPASLWIGNSITGAGATNNALTINGGMVRNAKLLVIGTNSASVSNSLSVLNGGQLVMGTNAIFSSMAGNYHSITVGGTSSAGVKSLLDFGGSGDRRLTVSGANTNLIWVGSGGVITNASFQLQAGTGNGVIVTNGGQVYLAANITVGRQGGLASYVIVGGTDAVGNNSLIASNSGSAAQILIACSGNVGGLSSNNWMRVDRGGVVKVANIFVGGGNGPETNIGINGLIITNGGQVTVGGSTTIGAATNTTGNWIYLGGNFGTTNSTLNHSGFNMSVGATTLTQAATNNFLLLATNGVLTNVNSVILGGVNSKLIFNGGTLAAGTNGMLIATNASTVGATNYVQAGGAIIDSVTYTVTNVLPLVPDPSSTGGGLTKLGVGTLVLTNLNTYTGGTLVSAGTLVGVSGVSSIANSAMTVLAGATNSVLVQLPGGLWTCGALTNNDGSTLDINLGAFSLSVSSAPLRVTGAFALTNANVSVRVPAALVPYFHTGQYPLVKYGSFSGTLTPATLSLPAGAAGFLSNNVANTSIDLVVTTGFTGEFWKGYVNGVWDDAVNQNWLGSAATIFNPGDAVVFDDTLVANTNVTGSATVSPGSVAFFNSLTNYSIAASIGGTGALTKSGVALVTLGGSNSFSGGVTLNAGTLAVGSTNALGTGTFTINGGTLDNKAGVFVSNVNNNAQTWNSNFNFAGSSVLNLGTGPVTMNNSITIAGTAANVLIVSGNISGTGGLSHSGNSSLTLSGNLSFSGGLTNTGGWLTNSGLNTYPGITALTGGTNVFNSITNVGAGASALGAPTTVDNGTLYFGGTLRYNGAGTSVSDRIFVGSGTIYIDTGALTLTGGITNGNNGGITFRGSGNVAESGIINIGSGQVTRTDGGIAIFTNVINPYTGSVSISDGTFRFDTIANSGIPCALGAGNSINLGQLNGGTTGTLHFIGTNGSSCNRAITITGGTSGANGGIISNSVVGATVTFSGNVTPFTTNQATMVYPKLTLTGQGNGVLSGSLGSTPTNGLAIIKNGTGIWTLSGLNTNQGSFTVNAGTLLINGNSIGATNTVTVASGASFGGNGTNGGNVNLSAGGMLFPGGLDAVGTLNTTNSLILNGNKLFFKLGNNAGTNDLVVVGQALSVAGVNTIYLSGASPIGTNTLMTCSSISGAGSFVLGAAYPNAFLITNGTSIQLAVTSSLTIGLTWKGYQTGVWDDAANKNWLGSAVTNFAAGNDVTFDDSLTANSTVSSAGAVLPNSVTFLNSLTNYTISAAIGGSGTLTKSGAASVTLTGANNYSGNTLVNAGTLLVTNGGAIYSPNATLNIAPATTSATATLTGSGAITVQSLTSTNVIRGGLTNSVFNFSGGTLTTSNAPTGTAANILVASNATYGLNSSWNMYGGTNTVSSVNIGYQAGNLVVGFSTNNVVLTVNSNATFANYNPSGTPTNISFIVGSAGTASFNRLIITNGGQATLRNGSGSVNLTIGNSAGNNANGLIVAGADGAGKKSLLNLGNDRLYIGNGIAGLTNNFALVDGGVLTNASMFSWSVNSTFVITNGGLAAGPNAYVGRNGLSNLWTVAGADASGKRATLLLTSAAGVFVGGAQIGTATPGTNNILWVDQNGLVTNTTAGKITVGPDTNSLGNGLVITNGGQVFVGLASQIGYTTNANNNYITIGGTFGSTNSMLSLGNTSLTIGNNAGASNNYATLFAGGIMTNVSQVVLGGANSALNFNGGQLSASASGILIATNATTANALNYVQAGGAILDTVTFNVTNVLPLTEDPSSTGGGLTKVGAGALVLPIASTYTGSTLVSAGTLLVNNASGSATGTGAVTVNSGAILGGNGTIGGDVILSSGALVTNVVGSPLTIGGAVTLNGNTMKVISTTALGAGDYVLIANTGGGITGSFASGVTVGGSGLAASTTASIVTTANSVLLRVVATTALNLVSSLNPSTNGDLVTFTATVQTNSATAVAASGSMVFKTGGTPVATNPVVSGVATYATSSLGVTLGVLITAEYSGTANYLPSTASLSQEVRSACTSPVIVGGINPGSATVGVGGTVTFALTNVTGSSLQYQWRSNSVAIAGALGTSYTTPALMMLANGGSYDCVVTNDCGTATAGAVSLTVTQAVPSITILSSAQTNGYHDSVYFTATNLPVGAVSNVVFTANGQAFSTNNLVAGGAISLAITNLPRGDTNLITAIYSGDTNYVSVAATLTQTVTNHIPTANVLTVYRTAGLSYIFRWSEIGTNWNDVDGDALYNSVTNLVSTNLVSLTNNGTLLLYPATAANVNDRFSYTINDLFGGTNTGYVDVIVDPFVGAAVTGQQTTNSIGGGPTFTVTYYGIPTYTYNLQRSTNLFDGLLWVNIATNTIGGGGKTNVVDDFGDLGVIPSEAFYRVLWKP